MEKIDIIKLMIKEKEEQEKAQTNFEEKKLIKLLHNYYDEYLYYKLINLSKDNIIIYNPNSKDEDEQIKTDEIKSFVFHTIEIINTYNNINIDKLNEKEIQVFNYLESIFSTNDDFYIKIMLNSFCQRKGNDNLSLLETKDKDYKKEVANKICDMLIVRTNIKKIKEFNKKYIIPIFKKLYSNKEIDFDIEKSDSERSKKNQAK